MKLVFQQGTGSSPGKNGMKKRRKNSNGHRPSMQPSGCVTFLRSTHPESGWMIFMGDQLAGACPLTAIPGNDNDFLRSESFRLNRRPGQRDFIFIMFAIRLSVAAV
jgi:hypothetical protein